MAAHHTFSSRLASAASAVTCLALGVVATASPASAAGVTFTHPGPVVSDSRDSYQANNTDFFLGDPTEPAEQYPSTVELAAPASATVDGVEVRVFINHPVTDELDLMLVSPQGTGVMLMSDAGGNTAINGMVRLVQAAPLALPDEAAPGLLNAPTDWDTTPGDSDTFPAPAPETAEPSLDVLRGEAAAGTWSLYAFDDTAGMNGDAVGFITRWEIFVSLHLPSPPGPSTLEVSGLPSGVTDVNLNLSAIETRNGLEGLEVLLESPDGRTANVISDAGFDHGSISSVDLILDDEASAPLPRNDLFTAGSYQPTDYDDGNELSGEAAGDLDSASEGSALSTFDGGNPNGIWKLYVASESCCYGDAISGGWSLQISTIDGPAAPHVTSPTPGARDPDATVTLTGTAATGSVVRVREAGAGATRNTLAENGAWALTLAGLAEGAHTYLVTATDAFGNTSPAASITFLVDTVAPAVAGATPKNKAKNVSRRVSPRITFSEKLLASSLTKGAITLAPVKGGKVGKAVKAKLTYLASSDTVVVDPRRALDDRTTYQMSVKPSVRDLTGHTLKVRQTWRFTT